MPSARTVATTVHAHRRRERGGHDRTRPCEERRARAIQDGRTGRHEAASAEPDAFGEREDTRSREVREGRVVLARRAGPFATCQPERNASSSRWLLVPRHLRAARLRICRWHFSKTTVRTKFSGGAPVPGVYERSLHRDSSGRTGQTCSGNKYTRLRMLRGLKLSLDLLCNHATCNMGSLFKARSRKS